MKLKLPGVILAIFLSAFLSACSDSGSNSGGGGDKEDLMLALGDSIAAGSETGGYAFPEISSIQTAIPVFNSAVPGSSAEAEVSRAPSLIAEHNPRIIIAMLGTNNALGSGGGADGAVRALQNLANMCEDNGIICIIGTLPPITISSTLNGNINNINAGIRGISNAIIAESGPVISSGDLLSDGIHPSAGGQNKIAEVYSARLIEVK